MVPTFIIKGMFLVVGPDLLIVSVTGANTMPGSQECEAQNAR